MYLRDLADVAFLIACCANGQGSSVHRGEAVRQTEIWKYWNFLCHAWNRELDRPRYSVPDTGFARLHEEILVVGTLFSTSLSILDRDDVHRQSRFFEQGARQQADLLQRCRTTLTTVPELLRLERLARRLGDWQVRLRLRTGLSTPVESPIPLNQPELYEILGNENVCWPLERAAFKLMIPQRRFVPGQRREAVEQVVRQLLGWLPAWAFDAEGGLRSRFCRQLEADAWRSQGGNSGGSGQIHVR